MSEFENIDVDFDEIKNFYNELPKTHQEKRAINIAMTTICSKFVDHEVMLFHLEKVIKSGDFISNDLCNYGYWRCFDKDWKQSDFFDFGKFLDQNLKVIPQDQLGEISKESGPKIRIGFLSADILGGHSITYFLKTILSNYDKKKFEIILILNNPKEDQSTKDFKDLVDESINIWNLDNVSAVSRVRGLKLDIIIDLMGYTSMNRIEIVVQSVVDTKYLLVHVLELYLKL